MNEQGDDDLPFVQLVDKGGIFTGRLKDSQQVDEQSLPYPYFKLMEKIDHKSRKYIKVRLF